MTRQQSGDDDEPDRSAAERLRDLIDPPSLRYMREMTQPGIIEQALAARNVLTTLSGRNLIEEALAAKRVSDELDRSNRVQDILETRKLYDRQVSLLELSTTMPQLADADLRASREQLAQLFGALNEFDRTRSQLWAGGIVAQWDAYKTLYTGAEFARVYAEATNLLNQPGAAHARALLSGALQPDPEFAATRAKLSMLAGTRDLFGFEVQAAIEARAAVLGQWHTHADLPQRFWRDPGLRARRYAEAEVDPGLIEADAGEALQVIVSSGFAAGVEVEGVSTAVIAFGEFNVTIEAKGSRSTAYHVLTAFEERLRRFVAAKMEAAHGPDWFKQRVDGEVVRKAKAARITAYRNGEPQAPLLDFTDLGELVAIVLRGDNWGQIFEPVFVNRARFTVDTQAMIAVRRPTMHARLVDGVRLVELVIVAQRLFDQMRLDGSLLAAAQADA